MITLAAARRARAVALLLGLGLAPACLAVEPEALMARMAEAMREQAYEGRLVYAHGDKLDVLELVHGYIDGREHERLRTLSGQRFEVIRMGEEVTCVWPASERVMVSQRPGDLLPPKPPRGLDMLPESYTASLERSARMVGRSAHVVRIRPADRYRYGYRMWIDRSTFLLLRSDLLADDGTAVEQLMFTRLEARDDIPAAEFERTLEGMEYTKHRGSAIEVSKLKQPRWRVRDLPAGFRTVTHQREAMPPRGHAVQHSVFTDGLASVSVFIEPPKADDMPLEGLSKMGAVHAFGVTRASHHITAVGEVPAATVKRIAQSVYRVPNGE